MVPCEKAPVDVSILIDTQAGRRTAGSDVTECALQYAPNADRMRDKPPSRKVTAMTDSLNRALMVVTIAMLALSLVGCGASVDVAVNFYRGEHWNATMLLGFSKEVLALAGGEDEMERQLDEMISEANELDIRASWQSTQVDDGLAYTIKMRGQGLDLLSEIIFGGDAEIYADASSGQRLVHFSQYVDPALGFSSYKIALRGGEIVDGNGQVIDGHTITWERPSGRIEAVLTERSSFRLGRVLGMLAGLAVVGGLLYGGLQWWHRSRALPPAPCPWCGSWIPEGARYCTECGRPR